MDKTDINQYSIPRGTELRVLKMAVSVTGEFTQSVEGKIDSEKVEEVLRHWELAIGKA